MPTSSGLLTEIGSSDRVEDMSLAETLLAHSVESMIVSFPDGSSKYRGSLPDWSWDSSTGEQRMLRFQTP